MTGDGGGSTTKKKLPLRVPSFQNILCVFELNCHVYNLPHLRLQRVKAGNVMFVHSRRKAKIYSFVLLV